MNGIVTLHGIYLVPPSTDRVKMHYVVKSLRLTLIQFTISRRFMMNIMIKAVAVSLALFSASAFADKIIITGQPIVLERQGDFYVAPKNYTVNPNYQYVLIDGKERACFLDARPDFVNLDVVSINVQVGTERATWNCYTPDTTYFEIKR